ncbi:MAG: Omp28-related outer membrane protein [Flavobacteriales bacterium]|jgi:hypothetical protein|nr:Omp28-related outer membrane protein [Flavobacteriales bacterium]
MKNLLLSFTVLSLGISASNAQTLVSTTVQKKNVLIEKFTSITCGACPGGSAEIESIIQAKGADRVSAYYFYGKADGPDDDFNMEDENNAIVGFSKTTSSYGTPSANISRNLFPDYAEDAGDYMIGKSSWVKAVDTLLTQFAYVNIGAKIRYDVEYKKFLVDVELYYTGTPANDQKLSIAVVQNDVIGKQAGKGDDYNHKHIFKGYITNGVFGESLGNPTVGDLITKTYTWDIPDLIGKTQVIPEDLQIVAFVSSGSSNVENVVTANPEPFVHYARNAVAKDKRSAICDEKISTVITLENMGNSPLTKVKFQAKANSQVQEYTWTGNLATFGTVDIPMPTFAYTTQANNKLEVKIIDVNDQGLDEKLADDSYTLEFEEPLLDIHSFHTIELKLDGFGHHISWKLIDQYGDIHASGNGYTSNSTELIRENYKLDKDLCYRFIIEDEKGNGLSGGILGDRDFNPGYIKLIDGAGNILIEENGNFGASKDIFFNINTNSIGLEETNTLAFDVFPNPSNGLINIKLQNSISETVSIRMMDNIGRIVYQGNHHTDNGLISINKENLANGIYTLEVMNETLKTSKRVIIQ